MKKLSELRNKKLSFEKLYSLGNYVAYIIEGKDKDEFQQIYGPDGFKTSWCVTFSDSPYFEDYVPVKFKKGDKVKFTGSNRHINKSKTFVILSERHHYFNNKLMIYYDIKEVDGRDVYDNIEEKYLDSVTMKYVISLSEHINCFMPAIHEVSSVTVEHKFANTWKNMFVYDTKEEAEEVARMFGKIRGKQFNKITVFDMVKLM